MNQSIEAQGKRIFHEILEIRAGLLEPLVDEALELQKQAQLCSRFGAYSQADDAKVKRMRILDIIKQTREEEKLAYLAYAQQQLKLLRNMNFDHWFLEFYQNGIRVVSSSL